MKKKRKDPKNYKKRTATPRQKSAKKNIVENLGTEGQALRDAGYSESYSNNPKQFNETQAGQDLIKICNDLRDKSLAHASEKLKEAGYSDSVRGADTLNKIGRLEGDKSTENITIEDLIRDRKKEVG